MPTIYSIVRKMAIFILADRLMNSDVHSHKIRSSHDFHRFASNSGPGSRTFLNICIKLWNDLPQQLKNIPGIVTFGKQIKKSFLWKISELHIENLNYNAVFIFFFLCLSSFNCFITLFFACHLRYSLVILLCCATSSLGCSPTFLVAISKQPVCCYLQLFDTCIFCVVAWKK